MYRDREWQICSLYQFTEEVGLWRKDSQFCEYVSDLSPIPLTPEILEKNGFEKGEIYEGNSSIVFTNGNIRISWYKNAMWCRLRIYNALGDTELCSAIVHNVHQLQHALRLAGVGKEIEV